MKEGEREIEGDRERESYLEHISSFQNTPATELITAELANHNLCVPAVFGHDSAGLDLFLKSEW